MDMQTQQKCVYVDEENIARTNWKIFLNPMVSYGFGLGMLDWVVKVVLHKRCTPNGAVQEFRDLYGQISATRSTEAERLVRSLAKIKRDHTDKFMPLLVDLCQERQRINGNWRLKTGEIVLDRKDSHLSPEVLPYLTFVFPRISWQGDRDFASQELGLGECIDGPIGEQICVVTKPADKITYGIRKGRHGYSRLVHGRQPEPTTILTVVLKMNRGCLEIITAFFGPNAPVEPNRDNAIFRINPDNSREFWRHHALLREAVEIQEGTETDVPPEVFGIK